MLKLAHAHIEASFEFIRTVCIRNCAKKQILDEKKTAETQREQEEETNDSGSEKRERKERVQENKSECDKKDPPSRMMCGLMRQLERAGSDTLPTSGRFAEEIDKQERSGRGAVQA